MSWLSLLLPGAISLLKDIFRIKSDNSVKRDTALADAAKASSEAKKAASEASAAEHNKNASLSASNKHIYLMLIIGFIVGFLGLSAFFPTLVISLQQNIVEALPPAFLDNLLKLLEDLVRSLAGITNE